MLFLIEVVADGGRDRRPSSSLRREGESCSKKLGFCEISLVGLSCTGVLLSLVSSHVEESESEDDEDDEDAVDKEDEDAEDEEEDAEEEEDDILDRGVFVI